MRRKLRGHGDCGGSRGGDGGYMAVVKMAIMDLVTMVVMDEATLVILEEAETMDVVNRVWKTRIEAMAGVEAMTT